MRNKFSKGKGGRKHRNGDKRTRRLGAKRRSVRPPRNRYLAPRTANQFFAMPKKAQVAWKQATHIVSKMRTDGVSLTKASREFGLSPRKAANLARPALRKQRDGRYVARKSDKLLRVLVLPTPKGLQEIATRDSRQASLISNYSIAVDRYLTSGDSTALRKFDGKKIKAANGIKVPLLTDLAELDRLASPGVLSFESIYAKR